MQSIIEMTHEEKTELKNEVFDAIIDYVTFGDFAVKGIGLFESRIKKIRLKHDISEIEMAMYVSVCLDIVINHLEENNS